MDETYHCRFRSTCCNKALDLEGEQGYGFRTAHVAGIAEFPACNQREALRIGSGESGRGRNPVHMNAHTPQVLARGIVSFVLEEGSDLDSISLVARWLRTSGARYWDLPSMLLRSRSLSKQEPKTGLMEGSGQ
jgi:hypothetical protein